MSRYKIKEVYGRQIIDSRGNPTVEAEVLLECGVRGRGASPSGASTGIYEAHELMDGDKEKYDGKSVFEAVKNINTVIRDNLIAESAADTYEVDNIMIKEDGTDNKSNFGLMQYLPYLLQQQRRQLRLKMCLFTDFWVE